MPHPITHPQTVRLAESPLILRLDSVLSHRILAEVGHCGVTFIAVFQEAGDNGRETGDIWLVVFDRDGEVFRILAAHAIVRYRAGFSRARAKVSATLAAYYDGAPAGPPEERLPADQSVKMGMHRGEKPWGDEDHGSMSAGVPEEEDASADGLRCKVRLPDDAGGYRTVDYLATPDEMDKIRSAPDEEYSVVWRPDAKEPAAAKRLPAVVRESEGKRVLDCGEDFVDPGSIVRDHVGEWKDPLSAFELGQMIWIEVDCPAPEGPERTEAHPVDRDALVELHDEIAFGLLSDEERRSLCDTAQHTREARSQLERDDGERDTVARLAAALGLDGED